MWLFADCPQPKWQVICHRFPHHGLLSPADYISPAQTIRDHLGK